VVLKYIPPINKKRRTMARKPRKNILVQVTPDEHQVIKTQAAKRHVSMRLYIMEAVERRIIEERNYEEENDVYAPRNSRTIR
jgi:hypothetical protein